MKKLILSATALTALCLVCLAGIGVRQACHVMAQQFKTTQTIQVDEVRLTRTPDGYYTVNGAFREIELNDITVTP
jgi:hypothetical protein